MSGSKDARSTGEVQNLIGVGQDSCDVDFCQGCGTAFAPANEGWFVDKPDVGKDAEGGTARLFREDATNFGVWQGFKEEDIGPWCDSCSWKLQRKRTQKVATDGGENTRPEHEVGYVSCPECGYQTGLEQATKTGVCAGCGREFTGEERSTIPSELAEGHWDEIHGEDYEPANGVDFAADEISKPERDIEAITDVLVDVETNDRIHATIGAAEAASDATFVVLTHERDVAGFDHRINFTPKPRPDGWTRLYQTGIGPEDLDPWEVVSMPYHVGRETADMRDFAANGWMIDCELTDDDLTRVDQNPDRDDVDDRKVMSDGGETIDRFTELPTPDRFFIQIEPAEIEMQPMDHDDVDFHMQLVPGGSFAVELSASYSYAGRECNQHLSLDREGAEELYDALGKALEEDRRR